MKNALNWFEIPSTNFERAVAFYNNVLQAELHREVFGGTPNAFLPYDNSVEDAVGGAVIFAEHTKPSTDGVMPYLNCNGCIEAVLARVEPAGGKIVMPLVKFPFGSIAAFIDTEGNRIGLHAA